MPSTPRERLERLIRNTRAGWKFVREDAYCRRHARESLAQHPSAMPEVDRLWHDCLAGTGELFAWIDASAPAEHWQSPIPLHTVLSSHPFPDLNLWSIRKKFNES